MYVQLYIVLLIYFLTMGINGQHDVCSCRNCHIINDKCFIFFTYDEPLKSYRYNYNEARDLCHSVDAILFEPKDNETNYRVNIEASENGWLNQQEYWIGINNITKGNSWIYDSDNSDITWTNWSSRGPTWDNGPQPNNEKNGEQFCVAMFKDNIQHYDLYDPSTWYDELCSEKLMEVVCEMVDNSYSTKSTTSTTTTKSTTTSTSSTTTTTTTSTTATSPIPTTTTLMSTDTTTTTMTTTTTTLKTATSPTTTTPTRNSTTTSSALKNVLTAPITLLTLISSILVLG